MATQTTYYEFNKPAGTDLVNPLVDTIPNWDVADAALHELNERSIANATETVAVGVHAISRLNTYTKFLKWIATANYAAGETFTVDGNVVAASTPSGAALETGAYVSGAVVIACLNADDTAMTIFVAGTTVANDSLRLGGELPSYYATAAAMGSAQTDIGNIQALNGNTSIAAIGDGTLTGGLAAVYAGLLNVFNVEYKTSPTAEDLQTAKLLIAHCGFSSSAAPFRFLLAEGTNASSFILWNGVSIQYGVEDIIWDKTAGTISITGVHASGNAAPSVLVGVTLLK